MKSTRLLRRSWIVLSMSIVTLSLFPLAYTQNNSFEPQHGQEGKDVIWVPTPQELVDEMLELAKVTKDDYLMDLGSGDGRLVITAAKIGANAIGIEYNEDMVEPSKRNAEKEGVSDKASFVKADLFESDFSKATVITLFLMTDLNLKLRPKLLDLKPGTRIVSNTFKMGDWEADETVDIGGNCYSWCYALLWIVPAKVKGKWKTQEGELILDQNYQIVSGSLKNGDNSNEITNGRLNGDQITFNVNDSKYTGAVSENTINGTFATGKNIRKWSAKLADK